MTPNQPEEWQRNGSATRADLDSRLAIVHRVARAQEDPSLTICGTRIPVTAEITDDAARVTCQACLTRAAWRCATCNGVWTNGVSLLGGRFHPTCEPSPADPADGQEVWDE